MGVEWVREGDPWPIERESALRAHLIEDGVIGQGQGGGLRIRFVGVIVHDGRTIVALPKVRSSLPSMDVHRHVLRAIKRYQRWMPTHHQLSPFLNESPDRGRVSGLAATDWLVRDFMDHGLLRRIETAHQFNGEGTVDWRRTIECVPVTMSRGGPLYFETVTRRTATDNCNFATRLHRHLLERLSADYGPVLDLEPILLDHEPVEPMDALPSVEECEARLSAEQRVTYSQRGIDLLAMMMATVRAIETETARDLSLYGTSYFHHVWEVACTAVFGNEVADWSRYIPKPHWTSAEGSAAEADTFIPDLVTALDADRLLIGDAKYYRPIMPSALAGVPGVNDVAKQIWYKQVLQREVDRRGYATVENVFLFPGDGVDLAYLGHVELPAGGERVDALSVPFMLALAAYSGNAPSDSATWLSDLASLLAARRLGNGPK